MSARTTAWVWRNSAATSTDVFVFLCLTECSGGGDDHSGVAGSYQQVADLARLDLATTRQSVNNLVTLGELEVDEHPAGHISWTIPSLLASALTGTRGAQKVTAPRSPVAGEVVYLIGSSTSRLVKIGRTKNVSARLRSIRNMSPAPLEVQWTTPGGYALEAHLHCTLARYRAHGEWFDFGSEDPLELIGPAVSAYHHGVNAPRNQHGSGIRIEFDHEWTNVVGGGSR
jgi:hypothetical protein